MPSVAFAVLDFVTLECQRESQLFLKFCPTERCGDSVVFGIVMLGLGGKKMCLCFNGFILYVYYYSLLGSFRAQLTM